MRIRGKESKEKYKKGKRKCIMHHGFVYPKI
jgi:hypothetical protein